MTIEEKEREGETKRSRELAARVINVPGVTHREITSLPRPDAG